MESQASDFDRELAERAAQWLITLIENGMLPRAREEFAVWLTESPRHAEEFLMAMAVWMQLDGLDPRHIIDLRRLLESAQSHGDENPSSQTD